MNKNVFQLVKPDKELWDKAWASSGHPHDFHTPILNSISQCIDLPGKRVIEVGCGSAKDSLVLAHKGAEVYGLDFSWKALERVQRDQNGSNKTIKLIAGDTLALPFGSETYDLVFSQGLIEHFKDPLSVLREQVRIIRQNGLLVVDVPQKYSFSRLKTVIAIHRGTWFAGWETAYSLDELENLVCQAGLKVIHTYGWMYSPSFLNGIRNLHTLDERHQLPVRLPKNIKIWIESCWKKLENQRWYYKWLACTGVVAQKCQS